MNAVRISDFVEPAASDVARCVESFVDDNTGTGAWRATFLMSSVEDAAAAMLDLIGHRDVMANVAANARLTVTFDRRLSKEVARICLGHRGLYDRSPWAMLHG